MVLNQKILHASDAITEDLEEHGGVREEFNCDAKNGVVAPEKGG